MVFSRLLERHEVLTAFFKPSLSWGALLVTAVFFVLGASAERHKPAPYQIERVKNEYDSVLWDCSASDCPHGTGLSVKCGTSVPYNISIVCEICEPGKTYSDTHNFDTCKDCLVCKENQVRVSGECTLEQDSTKCECKHGYYDDGNGDCKMCSPCCGNDRTLHVAGCDGMPPNQRCGIEHAGNCAPTTEHVPGAIRHATSAESANKLTYAVIGIGSTAGILLVLLFFLFLWCKCPVFKQKIKGICHRHSRNTSRAMPEVTCPLVPTNGTLAGQLEVVVTGSHAARADSDCSISALCEAPGAETHVVTVTDSQGPPQDEYDIQEAAPAHELHQVEHEVPEACLVALDDSLSSENYAVPGAQRPVLVTDSISQENAPPTPKLQSQKSHQPVAVGTPSHSLKRCYSHPGAHKESKQQKNKDTSTATTGRGFSRNGYVRLQDNESGSKSSAEASGSGTVKHAYENPGGSLEVPTETADQHTSTTDLVAGVTLSSRQKLATAREKVLAMRASEIPFTLLKNLSLRLNNKEQCVRDYRLLAEKTGLDSVEIRALDRLGDPTDHLLQKFGGKKEGSLGKLVEYLKEMERFDVVDVIDSWVDEQCQSQLTRTNV